MGTCTEFLSRPSFRAWPRQEIVHHLSCIRWPSEGVRKLGDSVAMQDIMVELYILDSSHFVARHEASLRKQWIHLP